MIFMQVLISQIFWMISMYISVYITDLLHAWSLCKCLFITDLLNFVVLKTMAACNGALKLIVFHYFKEIRFHPLCRMRNCERMQLCHSLSYFLLTWYFWWWYLFSHVAFASYSFLSIKTKKKYLANKIIYHYLLRCLWLTRQT